MFNKRYDKRFDFDRDGELSRRERIIRRRVLEEVKKVEIKQREEQELKEKYGWRDFCEDGSDYGIYPEDYETEEEYEDALYEAREEIEEEGIYFVEKVEKLDKEIEEIEDEDIDNFEIEVSVEEENNKSIDKTSQVKEIDYEDEEDYLEDLDYKKNGWKNRYRSGIYAKFEINIDDFDVEEEYLQELERKREILANNKKQREKEYHENIKRQVEEKASNRKEKFGSDDIYIFVGVVYEESNRVYNYLTEDESIDIGDIVAVPVGYENKEKEAQVVSVGKFEKIAAPYPPDKCKYVLRKLEM